MPKCKMLVPDISLPSFTEVVSLMQPISSKPFPVGSVVINKGQFSFEDGEENIS
jgi:hypothetical protein